MNRMRFHELIEDARNPMGLSFRDYFHSCLRRMHVAYRSLNRKLPTRYRDFDATGVVDALDQYAWPATIIPVKSTAAPYAVLSYDETAQSLHSLSDGLRSALESGDRVMGWVHSILWWGMGGRGKQSARFLNEQEDAAMYLLGVAGIAKLSGDTRDINNTVVHNYNSGLSKVHSLASDDGLIIYDSRVAFAIGECVNRWASAIGAQCVPSHLKFMQAGRRTTGNKTLLQPESYGGAFRHPRESRDCRWLETQMRASWLFEAALEDASDLWAEASPSERLRNLEAAFFMFGAYADTFQLPTPKGSVRSFQSAA